jgi:hypothetical protein
VRIAAATTTTDATRTPPAACPPGTHAAVILEAREVFDDFLAQRSGADNPRGQKLELRLEIDVDGEIYRPRVDIPAHWHKHLQGLAKSAGLPDPTTGGDWDETALVGRTVLVVTTNTTDARGRVWTRASRWLEREAAADAGDRKLPPPAAAKRPKPAPAAAADDDIPF